MNRLTTQLLLRDVQLFEILHTKARYKALICLMSYITHLGGAIFTTSIGIFLICLGDQYNKIGYEVLFVLSSSHLLVHIIKRVINRPRPYRVLEDVEITKLPFEVYSFPSGHTTAGFSLAMILSFYFTAFSPLFIFLGSLVALSRIYLGVHYPSDILVGAVIGISFAYLIHYHLLLNIC